MNDRSYLLIGGDTRQEYLYTILKSKNANVEKIFLNETENLNESSKKISHSNIIVLPIPTTKDGLTLFSPNYKKKVTLDFITEKIASDAIVFVGGETEIIKKCKSKNIINLLSNESLTLKNAMATAEATISIIIENSPHTIFGAEILIIGYGRIGKILADYLLTLKANVSICARKEIARTEAELMGANALDFETLITHLPKFSIIINTVPTLIFKKEELNKINKNALIVDLASNPGGIDFEFADKIGIKTIHALSLPGKYSPKSAAEFIEQAINNELI